MKPVDVREQEKARAEQAERERLERVEEIGDFKLLLQSMEGRRFVWRLFKRAGLFNTTFRANGKEQDFLEGARNFALPLWADLMEHAPEKYLQMVKENASNARK